MEDKESTIENRLRVLRKQHSLSQEELGSALGISRQSIIALEQGRSLPSLPLITSMCKFFDTAFEEIFACDFDSEVKNIAERKINIKFINDPVSIGSRKEQVMELEPWRPFRESVSLRDAMDRLFEDSVITPGRGIGTMPKIDIKEKKDEVIVKAELPGILEEDIAIEILDNIMTISGEKKEDKEEKDENPPFGGGYFYKESHTGTFSRSFTLPSEVLAEKATAEMKNGVLIISVPKIEPKQAKKVKIGGKK
jgi:HSP20 family protein